MPNLLSQPYCLQPDSSQKDYTFLFEDFLVPKPSYTCNVASIVTVYEVSVVRYRLPYVVGRFQLPKRVDLAAFTLFSTSLLVD